MSDPMDTRFIHLKYTIVIESDLPALKVKVCVRLGVARSKKKVYSDYDNRNDAVHYCAPDTVKDDVESFR